MRLYLIRHGKTRANEEHRYCGSTDLPLSQRGMAELTGLGYELPRARLLTSGMARTEQTLEALFGPVPHGVDPGFREMDFGCFEMKTYEELKEDPVYQTWLAGDNETNVPPGGESGVQMRKRVIAALEAVLDTGEDTLIVTHGGVIAAIMAHLFPGEGKNRYQWQPENGRGYRIENGSYAPIPEENA